MKHRLLNLIRARLGGYFWLPCPLCGQYFGGHEWRSYDGKPASIPTAKPGTQTAICADCARAGLGRDPLDNEQGRTA